MNNYEFINKIEEELIVLKDATMIIINDDTNYLVVKYTFRIFDIIFYREHDRFQIQFITSNKKAIDAIILINYIQGTKNFNYSNDQILSKINLLFEKIVESFKSNKLQETINCTSKLKKEYQKERWS